jgi:hypothetical protein
MSLVLNGLSTTPLRAGKRRSRRRSDVPAGAATGSAWQPCAQVDAAPKSSAIPARLKRCGGKFPFFTHPRRQILEHDQHIALTSVANFVSCPQFSQRGASS